MAARRALVVVDVQQEYFGGRLAVGFPPVHTSLAKILDALDVAGRAGVPVVIVRHENPAGAAVFAAGSPGWELHPRLDARIEASWKRVTKSYASCFDGTDLADWAHQQKVDTLTLAGYMTNNCILATAAAAGPLGFSAEVLSDATGSIHLTNAAGSVSARQLNETLLALLHSNFAAVATSEEWASAVDAGTPLSKSNLLASAEQGRIHHADQ